MDRVTVFLRTSLFSFGGHDAHVPAGVMVVVGRLIDKPNTCVILETHAFLDERGRKVSEEGMTIHLPWAKIDHILVHEND